MASALAGIIAASINRMVSSSTHSLRMFSPPVDNPENDNSRLWVYYSIQPAVVFSTFQQPLVVKSPVYGTVFCNGKSEPFARLQQPGRGGGLGAAPPDWPAPRRPCPLASPANPAGAHARYRCPGRRSYWPGPAPSGPSARTMLRAAALRHSLLSRGPPAPDVAGAPAPWRSRAAPLPALGCAAAGRRAVASPPKRLRSIGGARVGAARRPLSRPAPGGGGLGARLPLHTGPAFARPQPAAPVACGQPCKAWPGVPVALSVLGAARAL